MLKQKKNPLMVPLTEKSIHYFLCYAGYSNVYASKVRRLLVNSKYSLHDSVKCRADDINSFDCVYDSDGIVRTALCILNENITKSRHPEISTILYTNESVTGDLKYLLDKFDNRSVIDYYEARRKKKREERLEEYSISEPWKIQLINYAQENL